LTRFQLISRIPNIYISLLTAFAHLAGHEVYYLYVSMK